MALEIYPAIDLLRGAAVRLLQGRYDEVTVYDADPVAIATRWRGRTPRLHVVDLEGARGGELAQLDAVRALVAAFGPGVQVGGGVRSLDAAEAYLSAGAARVVLGTAAVEAPDLVRSIARGAPGRVVLAVDAKDGLVATRGWETVTTRTSIDVVRSFDDAPIGAVLYTDISRDGTRAGPNVEATSALGAASPFPVLASGGVGALDHVRALAAAPTIAGVVIGKALHDGVFSIEDARALGA
ncbi:MAG: 1-(5-phosphoribosyl)-5-((5-phosphoribosylamino)methylideneamino)imidazole-4-carboxamide isomerase [Polyangiaceae bacterium]|nr:1-(5-phosphoribosyl)-5-((5-phosphoribosylamino)methylideneamino)imidazole-4-carboxamide isomerase [Polyangiaceae bacterium]